MIHITLQIWCQICGSNFLALFFKVPTPARGGEMRTAILVVFDTQTFIMIEQIGLPTLQT